MLKSLYTYSILIHDNQLRLPRDDICVMTLAMTVWYGLDCVRTALRRILRRTRSAYRCRRGKRVLCASISQAKGRSYMRTDLVSHSFGCGFFCLSTRVVNDLQGRAQPILSNSFTAKQMKLNVGYGIYDVPQNDGRFCYRKTQIGHNKYLPYGTSTSAVPYIIGRYAPHLNNIETDALP